MARLTRRSFLTAAGIGSAAMLALGADAVLFEPNDPRLTRLEVPLQRLPAAFDGLTIAQISDMHYDPHFSVVPIRKAVTLVNQLKPDLVVLTGDFITLSTLKSHLHHKRTAANNGPPCARLLQELVAPLGVFAILGNHDLSSGHDLISSILSAHHIPVLRNRSVPIERDGARLWMAGIDDALEGDPDFRLALKDIPANEPVVLLAHEPDMADDAAAFPIDLQLSGHSHGGQVRFPLVGPLYLPDLGQKYPLGLYHVEQLCLYTNRGIGTITFPVRFRCPPEVALFTLRSRPDLKTRSSR